MLLYVCFRKFCGVAAESSSDGGSQKKVVYFKILFFDSPLQPASFMHQVSSRGTKTKAPSPLFSGCAPGVLASLNHHVWSIKAAFPRVCVCISHTHICIWFSPSTEPVKFSICVFCLCLLVACVSRDWWHVPEDFAVQIRFKWKSSWRKAFKKICFRLREKRI